MTESDIVDGHLNVEQGKTGRRIRIAIEGELKVVIDRILARKARYKTAPSALIVNQYGHPVVARTVSKWLKDVREKTGIDPESFQFRDLRAKAATDKDEQSGIEAAQNQLGHTSARTTARYVRNRLGKKVSPTR